MKREAGGLRDNLCEDLYLHMCSGKRDLAGAIREAREKGHAGREAHEQGQQRHVMATRAWPVARSGDRGHGTTTRNWDSTASPVVIAASTSSTWSINSPSSSYLETYEPQQHLSISGKAQDKGTEKRVPSSL